MTWLTAIKGTLRSCNKLQNVTFANNFTFAWYNSLSPDRSSPLELLFKAALKNVLEVGQRVPSYSNITGKGLHHIFFLKKIEVAFRTASAALV